MGVNPFLYPTAHLHPVNYPLPKLTNHVNFGIITRFGKLSTRICDIQRRGFLTGLAIRNWRRSYYPSPSFPPVRHGGVHHSGPRNATVQKPPKLKTKGMIYE